MQAIESLKNEHRAIELVLDRLELLAEDCEQRGKLESPTGHHVLDFFRYFADHCHQHKEENHLYALLEARCMATQASPLATMRDECDRSRHYLTIMTAVIDHAEAGVPEAVAQFVRQARRYVRLVREQIQDEDQCLFPMANQVLTAKDLAALEQAFARVERLEMGTGSHDYYLQMAQELASTGPAPNPRLEGCDVHAK